MLLLVHTGYAGLLLVRRASPSSFSCEITIVPDLSGYSHDFGRHINIPAA